MSKLRIFVDFATPPDLLEQLQAGTQGHELVLAQNPVTSVLAKAQPDPQFSTVDIAFGQPDVEAIAGAPRLKWIHISSSGITRYDQPAFRAEMARRNIVVTNSAGVYNEACALHVLSFILAQARHLPLSLQTRTPHGSPAWHELRGSCVPLAGQTMLLVGYGAIASRLVEFLRPLGLNITAYRRNPRGDESVSMVSPNQLPAALAGADHVVNILPASAETRNFFNATRFAQLKPGAIFYNIGRGNTVDQAALLAALRAGQVGAAWLDVTEPEPLPDSHPLWSEPNCFITPHVAGGHARETHTLIRHFLKNFERFTQGKPLLDRVM